MKMPLTQFESNVESQTGEDGVIAYILSLVGDGAKVAVEFGSGGGVHMSNTWRLEHECGWRRFLFDGDAQGNPQVHEVYLTAENINETFDKAGVPQLIDVMSIDTDGNDYWLWKALRRRTRIVVAEYNTVIRPPLAMTIQYNPEHRWDGTNYFGATLTALASLAKSRGLRLVHRTYLNGIFLDEHEAEEAGLAEVSALWEQRFEFNRFDPKNRHWINLDDYAE